MSAYFGTEDKVTPAVLFDYAEAVTVVFEPGKPADVKRIILVGVEVGNGAETITVAIRDAGDAGNSVTVGTFVIPNGFAVDAVAYVDIADVKTAVTGSDASQPATVNIGGRVLGIQTNDPGVAEVAVGKEIACTSTGGTATTGQVNLYFEYIEGGQEIPSTWTELAFTLA